MVSVKVGRRKRISKATRRVLKAARARPRRDIFAIKEAEKTLARGTTVRTNVRGTFVDGVLIGKFRQRGGRGQFFLGPTDDQLASIAAENKRIRAENKRIAKEQRQFDAEQRRLVAQERKGRVFQARTIGRQIGTFRSITKAERRAERGGRRRTSFGRFSGALKDVGF